VSCSFRPGCAGSSRRDDKQECSLGYDTGLEQLWFGDAVDLVRPDFCININDLTDDNLSFTSYAAVCKAEMGVAEGFVSPTARSISHFPY
jgi:hypothetical protein